MKVLRLGVSGLGRGAMLTLPGFAAHPRLKLSAAFDPSADARDGFRILYGGTSHTSFHALCSNPLIDAIYIASPHECHAEQSVAAAKAGKHVLVEKPMALHLSEAAAMIAAAREAGTRLLVGPSHGYDPPVALARGLIASGHYGRPQMIQSINYTDFLYRPRRPEELDTSRGGGVVFSQATHQIDIVRRLIGTPVRTVRACVSGWDRTRGTDGAYSALLLFDEGPWASLTYSGYGRWDSDVLSGGIGELGLAKHGGLMGPGSVTINEVHAKRLRGFAGISAKSPLLRPTHHEHFGFLLVSCEHADLEVGTSGVIAHSSEGQEEHRVPLSPAQRYAVAEALVGAVLDGENPVFDGRWGLQTLACCHAILQSSAQQREVGPADLLNEFEERSHD